MGPPGLAPFAAVTPLTSGRYSPSQLRAELEIRTGLHPLVSPEARSRFIDMAATYGDVLVANSAALPTTIPHTATTPIYTASFKSTPPVVTRSYPVPHAKLETFRAHVDTYVKAGILEPAPPGTPAYATGYLTEQKPGKYRLIGDWRGVNSCIASDPALNDRLETDMRGSVYCQRGMEVFSYFDCCEGYTGIRVSDDTARLLAIKLMDRVYYVHRLLFGVSEAPGVFHSAYADIVDKCKNVIAAPPGTINTSQFIDDLLLGTLARDIDVHITFLKTLFDIFRENGWLIKLPKSSFLQTSGKYCGMIVDGTKISVDPERVNDFTSMPSPRNAKALVRVLGVFNYFAHYVPTAIYTRMLAACSPLRNVSNPDFVERWNAGDAEPAFRAVIHAIVTNAVTVIPDLDRPLYIRSDASDIGHGGVILQYDRVTGVPQIVAYWSRLWGPTQLAWNPGRKEAYALYYGITRVADRFIKGAQFVVAEVDAHNLSSITSTGGNLTSSDPLIRRWFTYLLQYPFRFEFPLRVPGKINFVSDMGSRIGENFNLSTPLDRVTAALSALVETGQQAVAREAVVRRTRSGARTAGDAAPSTPVPPSPAAPPPPPPPPPPLPPTPLPPLPTASATSSSSTASSSPTSATPASASASSSGTPSSIIIPGNVRLPPLSQEIVDLQRDAPDEERRLYSSSPFEIINVSGVGDVVLFRGALYVPTNATAARDRLITAAHDVSGHPGVHATVSALRAAHVNWPGREADVRTFVASCVPCQRFKAPPSVANTGVSEPTASTHPYHLLYVDFIGPITGKYILAILDRFSGYLWLRSVASTASTSLIAGLTSLFDILGTPNVLRVDSGSGNVSASLRKFVDERHVVLSPSPGYAPFTLGAVEGRNDTIRQLAQINFGADGHGAADALTNQTTLNKIADMYNTTPNYTGFSPFRIFRGYEPSTAVRELTGCNDVGNVNVEGYVNSVSLLHLLTSIASSTSQLKAAHHRDSKRDELPKFNIGDYVLVWYPPLHKLDTAYRGPFVIESRRTPSWYFVRRLVDRGNVDAVPFEVHVSRLRFFNASRTSVDRLLAHGLDTSYDIVTGIVSHRIASDGQYEFEVTWSDGTTTFSPPQLLSKVTLFKDYVASHGIDLHRTRAAPSGAPRGGRRRGRGRGIS